MRVPSRSNEGRDRTIFGRLERPGARFASGHRACISFLVRYDCNERPTLSSSRRAMFHLRHFTEFSPLYLAQAGLTIWMLIDASRRGVEFYWFWIILFFQPF